MALELTTAALVQAALFPAGTTPDTTYVTAAAQAAEDLIKRYCNRWPDGFLNTSAHTEKFPGDVTFGEPISLLYSPVTAITSVKVFTASASSSTIASTNYRIESNGLQLSFINYGSYDAALAWYASGMDVRPGPSFLDELGTAYPYTEVVYTGGYASQSVVPADLQQAAIDVARMIYNGSRGTKEDRATTEDIEKRLDLLLRHHRRKVGV